MRINVFGKAPAPVSTHAPRMLAFHRPVEKPATGLVNRHDLGPVGFKKERFLGPNFDVLADLLCEDAG